MMTPHCLPTSRFLLTGLVGVGLLLGALLSPVGVQAQVANLDEITTSQVGLQAIPPRLGDDGSLVAQPGEVLQATVRVRNTSNETQTVRTVVEDFIIGEDGVTPVPVTGTRSTRWSLSQWTNLTQNTVTLGPNESQTVLLLIDVPEDALPGGRYAMVMHQPIEDGQLLELDAETAGQASINQRVGTLLYVQVAGDITEEAHIRNVDIPRFSEFGPVPVRFEIENLSDIHIRPMVVVRIRNMFGQLLDEIQVESKNVFPYSLRSFETEWERVWGFGRYRAEFEVVYGSQGQILTMSLPFWVLPYRLILAVLVLILAGIGIYVAIRRHLAHRSDVSQQHIDLLEERIRQLEEELHTQDE